MRGITREFIILGPQVAPASGVDAALTSLSYLPSQYKLLLPLAVQHDVAYYNDTRKAIRRMALGRRVRFVQDYPEPLAILVNDPTPTDMRDERLIAAGGSPEALASAILRRARTVSY